MPYPNTFFHQSESSASPAEHNRSRSRAPGSHLPLLVMLSLFALSACTTPGAVDPGTVDPDTAVSSGDDGAATEQEAATDDGISVDTESAAVEEPVTVTAEDTTVIAPSSSLDGDMLFNLLAAEFAGNEGDIQTSLEYYREASEQLEDSRVAARAAYIALYGKDYEATLVALDRWQELEPEATDLSRMYAVTYLNMGRPGDAVPYISQMLDAAHESDIDEAMAVKQLLAQNASNEDAYVVLQQLNAGDNRSKHMLVLQSRYAAQLQLYDEALVQLDDVLEIDPELYEVLIIKSRILTITGRHEEAAALVKQVLDKLPDNNTLRQQYARMLVEQNDLQAAVEQYGVLYQKLPDDGDIVLSYALINIELQRLDEASGALQHLIETDQQVPVANYYLGRIAQNQGEDKQAVAYYLRVKDGEYVFDSQLRIGMLLAELGKPDEGLKKLEVLGEQTTDWSQRVRTYLARGEILRSERRYKEGVEMYSRALQQNNDDTNLLYARGLMAEKVDRLDMTESDLRKVISKEPDNADALNALGYTLADRTKRYQEALDYIQRAAELVPDDPAILDSLGWVSYRLGRMDDALKWLSEAFSKLADAEIAAHYGEVLWFSNQKDKAREVWQKGKEQNADNPVLIETLERIKP